MIHSGVLYKFWPTAGPPKLRGARVAKPLKVIDDEYRSRPTAADRCLVVRLQAESLVMSDLRRLATFARVCTAESGRWSVSCLTLAQHGFIYAGQADHVVCESCGVGYRGWLGTRRNPANEHRCPRPSCTATETIALTQQLYLRDQHGSQRSTIHDMYRLYVAALKRAARSGVLSLAETHHDLTPTAGRFSTAPGPDTAAFSHHDVTSDVTMTSYDSREASVLRLTLSLAKPKRRRSFSMHYCPWCCWWQHLGI